MTRSLAGSLAAANEAIRSGIHFTEDRGGEEWDQALLLHPRGQFQQSSMWGRTKQSDGWAVSRLIARVADSIVGGFQVLHRRKWFARIGYVSKGPVALINDPCIEGVLLDQLQRFARSAQLEALVVQPPDTGEAMVPLMRVRGFQPNMLVGVNDATLVVDLRRSLEEINAGMNRTTRRAVRQAQARGAKVRDGGVADLDLFFELMAATCRRQKTQPVPRTAVELRQLWEAFHERGLVRLSLLECEGRVVAGGLCVRFGKVCTFWKKGWSGEHAEAFANELLTYDAICWGKRVGCETFDFAAVDREFAKRVVEGRTLTPNLMRTRHFFNYRFGAVPRLLPEALVWFCRPWAARIYGMAHWCKRASALGFR